MSREVLKNLVSNINRKKRRKIKIVSDTDCTSATHWWATVSLIEKDKVIAEESYAQTPKKFNPEACIEKACFGLLEKLIKI